MVSAAGGLLKTLLVLRHARARRGSPTGRDRDRPLDVRGEEQARTVGARLAAEGPMPDLVLCSPAERAAETARIAAESGGFAERVTTVEELYGLDPGGVLELLARRGPGHDRILLVGHDPTASDLVELLSDRRRPLATGTLAVLEFDLEEWSHVGRGSGRLVEVWRPGGQPTS